MHGLHKRAVHRADNTLCAFQPSCEHAFGLFRAQFRLISKILVLFGPFSAFEVLVEDVHIDVAAVLVRHTVRIQTDVRAVTTNKGW